MKTNKKMIAGIVAMSSIANTAQVAAVHAENVTVQPKEVKVEEKQKEDNSQAKPKATQESVIQDAAQLKETVDQQTTNVSQKQKEYDQSTQNKAQAQESVNVALTHKEQELSKALDDLNAKKDALSKAQKELADINNQIDQNQKDLLAAQKEKEQAEAALKAAETVKKEDVEKAKADVDAKSQEESLAKTALNKLEIDELGLDDIDRKILETIIIKYNGGPVGLETLATTVGEEVETIEDVYEPYLMQIGFISRTPRGRVALQPAYRHIGIEINNN